jgi:hypothetical protein
MVTSEARGRGLASRLFDPESKTGTTAAMAAIARESIVYWRASQCPSVDERKKRQSCRRSRRGANSFVRSMMRALSGYGAAGAMKSSDQHFCRSSSHEATLLSHLWCVPSIGLRVIRKNPPPVARDVRPPAPEWCLHRDGFFLAGRANG